jgi:ABC-2 type transport system ATP-binding protein
MFEHKTAIEAHGLTKQFGRFTAVDHLDFEVYKGEIFGFLGPNGSGKTTTIRMMLGLLAPTEGSVQVLELPVQGHAREIRPRVGYMAQQFSLYNDLTALQNLRFYGQAYGLGTGELEDRIREALQLADLEAHAETRTGELAGGWRQRLALSAAILHQPEILFLDEPTAGVDPISRRAFWNLLYRLVAQEVTVFVTTHYMDEAEHCHRLAFIQRGKLIAYGSPEEIKREKMQGEVLEIQPSDTAKAVKILRAARNEGRLPLKEVDLYGSLVHVVAPEARKRKKDIARELRQADIEPGEMAVIQASLEDVFIASMR